MSEFKIRAWRPVRKGALLGFCQVAMPSGMILIDVTILTGERGPWASPPARPMTDRDGTPLRDERNKVRYAPVIEFSSRNIRDRWSKAVIEVMRVAHPEALGSEP